MSNRPLLRSSLRVFVVCVIAALSLAFATGAGSGQSLQNVVCALDSKSLPFNVDVWTDTGGQGAGASAGTYGPADSVMVYVESTWDCEAAVAVGLTSGELLAMMDVRLVAGDTLELPVIPLWDLDAPEGSWVVTVDAVSGDNLASDSVRFDVGTGPAPATGAVGELTVDVLTDRGGRGVGVPGGMYCIGDSTTVTIDLGTEADVTLVLEGPGTSDSDSAHLLPGTHTIDLGLAESGDEGVWTIEVLAVADGQQASDHVQFSVLSDDIWGGVALTPGTATELDALIALKMALGKLAEDPIFDVDRDGSITAADADQILLWAVSR